MSNLTTYNLSEAPTTFALRNFLQTAGVVIPADMDEDTLQLAIDAAVGDFEHKTQRQFVPGCVGEVRYYDGSNTGELVIDEYIDVSAVEIMAIPNYGSGSQAVEVYQVRTNGKPSTKLQIFQGPSNYPAFFTVFPQGRSNIKVTGQFGYAATIPAEVYQAMLKSAGTTIVNMLTLRTRDDSFVPGRLVSWSEADATEKYADTLSADVLGWPKDVAETIRDHTKPRPRRMRPIW